VRRVCESDFVGKGAAQSPFLGDGRLSAAMLS
jgi:hypothetical protein